MPLKNSPNQSFKIDKLQPPGAIVVLNPEYSVQVKMKKPQALAQKYWPAAVWLLFASLIAVGGFQPGKEPITPYQPPYPLVEVAMCWGAIAIALFALHSLILPKQQSNRTIRLLFTFGVVALLLFLALLGTGTDLPGYIPPTSKFAVLALLLLAARGLYSAFKSLVGLIRREP